MAAKSKPPEKRMCPFYSIKCIREQCAIWQDEAGACAFNVIAGALPAAAQTRDDVP